MTKRIPIIFMACCAISAVLAVPSRAQVYTLTKDQLIELTSQNKFDRFPDGRPKIPDALLERARGMSAEEVWGGLNLNAGGGGRGGPAYRNQYEDNFQVLHPKLKLVGRAFTVQFMPARPDMDAYANAKAKAAGLGDRIYNQTAIDMLQPGDVLVVDLFGKVDGGTIVGDNLFYYIMKATKTGGIVVDGAVRDDDAGVLPQNAPQRDCQRDAHRDQRPGSNREYDGDARRYGGGRPGGCVFRAAAPGATDSG